MKYVNVMRYRSKKYPIQIFIGGRGTGKTYSALEGVTDKEQVPGKFIYMRRTGQQMEISLDDDKKGEGVNPFKKLNSNKGTNYGFRAINKKIGGCYVRDAENKPIGAPIGYITALSIIAGIRGIDFSDVDIAIYDEFCKEPHEKALKEEAFALLNAYETINRNRELEDKPPMEMLLLSNSDDIYNPIFVGLGIVSLVEKMIRRNQQDLYIEERGLAIHLLQPAKEFIEAKSQTALYKLSKGTKFYDMALNNEFAKNDFSLIGWKSLKGYVPLCNVSNKCCIYKKKNEPMIYVSYALGKLVENYNTEERQDIIRFCQEIACTLHPYFVARQLYFESYELKEFILQFVL